MFGSDIIDSVPMRKPSTSSHTAKQKETEKEKEKLKAIPLDDLVAKMLSLQTQLASKERARTQKNTPSHRTESVARHLTESWVKLHSREASEEAGSERKKGVAGKKRANADDGKDWDQVGCGEKTGGWNEGGEIEVKW